LQQPALLPQIMPSREDAQRRSGRHLAKFVRQAALEPEVRACVCVCVCVCVYVCVCVRACVLGQRSVSRTQAAISSLEHGEERGRSSADGPWRLSAPHGDRRRTGAAPAELAPLALPPPPRRAPFPFTRTFALQTTVGTALMS
jgi:hypothetical protein